jgi:flagellar basal body-associated protein FliL
MKFTLSPLKKMLKKHWRLLLVLIVVLILSFYLYRTYYLEGNTSEPESESEPVPGPVPGTESEYNLTAEQERTVNAIKEDLIASFYKVNNNYSEGEQNSGNSGENPVLSDAINRLKNLSQEEEMS